MEPDNTADPKWIAISDHTTAINPAALTEVVQRGSFVLEFSPPKGGAAVLLDYKAYAGWARAFSIFQDEHAGLIVLHRQADTVRRHGLPGPLPRDWALARLIFSWDGPARTWSIRLEDCAGTGALQADGANPIPMTGADILALCGGQNVMRKHVSVQWFGACLHLPANRPSTWIGKRSPIATGRGPVAAEDLRVGDDIVTRDNGLRPLRALHHLIVPSRGRFAPILLRAPYFSRATDLLVSQDQLTLLSGAAVEYLFGEDTVLVSADALRDGNSALTDTRRPMTSGIALDLGTPELILADGCALLSLAEDEPLPYRLLEGFEALPLRSLLGRGGQRNAA